MAAKAKNGADKRKRTAGKHMADQALGRMARGAATKPKQAKASPIAHRGKKLPEREAKKRDAGAKSKVMHESSNGADDDKGDTPRRLGIRGAAPWAARHAAKHAAEARARAAEPPPPGSARATLRVPMGAEELKAKIVQLHNALLEVKALRKNLARNFYEIGIRLRDMRDHKMYEARGFGSFEAFLDREVDLGKTVALRLIRIVETFYPEPAIEHGMERVLQALNLLEAVQKANVVEQPAAAGASTTRVALPMRPPAPAKK
jgi:hypothetical protein